MAPSFVFERIPMHDINVAVVGACGLVGQSLLELLAQRQFPAARVIAVDTAEHEAETVSYGNLELDVTTLDDFVFDNVALAFFVAGSDAARRYVPLARAAGCVVVDFSSAFRLDPGVSLVVPAVNGERLAGCDGLVAAPNCTVTPLARALAPLKRFGLSRVSVATYQSVSGSGQAALEELANQTTALFSQRESESQVYAKRIAFNVLPQIGALDEAGDADEERSLRDELRKLLELPALRVEAHCVRVPVFFGHGWAVSVELAPGTALNDVRKHLVAAGLQLVAADSEQGYVTPMEATGNDGVWLSRLRATEGGVSFWLAADNARTGAALNCVEIAEAMMQNGYFA